MRFTTVATHNHQIRSPSLAYSTKFNKIDGFTKWEGQEVTRSKSLWNCHYLLISSASPLCIAAPSLRFQTCKQNKAVRIENFVFQRSVWGMGFLFHKHNSPCNCSVFLALGYIVCNYFRQPTFIVVYLFIWQCNWLPGSVSSDHYSRQPVLYLTLFFFLSKCTFCKNEYSKGCCCCCLFCLPMNLDTLKGDIPWIMIFKCNMNHASRTETIDCDSWKLWQFVLCIIMIRSHLSPSTLPTQFRPYL